MAKPELVVADESFKTTGLKPTWSFMELGVASKNNDEDGIAESLLSIVDTIVVDEEKPRFRKFLNTYTSDDPEDNGAEVFVKLFTGVTNYFNASALNPKA